jgi:hypothetical protein
VIACNSTYYPDFLVDGQSRKMKNSGQAMFRQRFELRTQELINEYLLDGKKIDISLFAEYRNDPK